MTVTPECSPAACGSHQERRRGPKGAGLRAGPGRGLGAAPRGARALPPSPRSVIPRHHGREDPTALAGNSGVTHVWIMRRPSVLPLALGTGLFLGLGFPLAGQDTLCPALSAGPDSAGPWQESPGVPGRSMIVLQGGRALPGLFIERLKFKAGFRAPAHVHSEPLYVTVLCGTALLGWGLEPDSSRLRAYPAGAFFVIPPDQPHYEWFDREAVVEVVGIGPVRTWAASARAP